jgi:hypothetical protein
LVSLITKTNLGLLTRSSARARAGGRAQAARGSGPRRSGLGRAIARAGARVLGRAGRSTGPVLPFDF